MFTQLLRKFFGLSFFESSEETQLISRLHHSQINNLMVSDENCVSIPIETLKKSSKIKALQARLLSNFKGNIS